MAKPNSKTAGQKQPESRRGKSRYEAQTRSARVILPERPPREVDNEIVAILLGADPTQIGVTGSPQRSEPPADNSAQAASQSPDLQISQALPFPADQALGPMATATAPARKSTRRVLQAAPAHAGASRDLKVGAQQKSVQQPIDQPITSFEDFTARWRHGLRKGQFKVCEALYQKTYALGTTECSTSFAELARLSGLKMRQCFNIISQLEALGFIERNRSLATSNKKDQGSTIRFHLLPNK